MSLGVVYTRAEYGMESPSVRVEAHLSAGLPRFNIVGLPEKAVNESRARVRSAVINCGFVFPAKHITVNLSPADLPKSGGRLDLAIALGILAASGQIKSESLDKYEFLGELALGGEILPVRGIISAGLACARTSRTLITSRENANMASRLEGVDIYTAEHLIQVTAHINQVKALPKIEPVSALENPEKHRNGLILDSIIGQQQAKRALIVAAAGGHNMLMFGPPGSGKTMLARRLPELLPPLSHNEALEVASISSLKEGESSIVWGVRPFRAPHHTASTVALVGGGSRPIPGEISLAHHGVLFMDEFPEFSRQSLEVMRQPLESGDIIVSRALRNTRFPAVFQLIAAMNPCPCGNLGSPYKECRCTPQRIDQYRSKISGPLLDRLDLIIHVTLPDKVNKNTQEPSSEKTEHRLAQERVKKARDIQLKRNNKLNSRLTPDEIMKFCMPTTAAIETLTAAQHKFGISMRGYHRLLRVGRTLADMEEHKNTDKSHIMEALAYRCEFDNR